MKVFVATTQTQGRRPNDFFHAKPGEILKRGIPCGKERGHPDGDCGCQRSLVGTGTLKATTTFVVADLTGTKTELLELLRDSARQSGMMSASPTVKELREVEVECNWIMRHANKYPAGTFLEYRSGILGVRSDQPSTDGDSAQESV